MISQDQRYFHFVILKEKNENGITTCINFLERLNCKDYNYQDQSNESLIDSNIIHEIVVKEDEDFSNGQLLINKDNYFIYKFFYIINDLCGNKTLTLIFPYLKLAKIVTNKMKESLQLLKYISFIYLDFRKIIHLNFESNLNSDFLSQCTISSIDITPKDELYLSSVKFSGEDPLKSKFFKSIFFSQDVLPKIENHTSIDDKVLESIGTKRLVLGVEHLLDIGISYSAKIHTDSFGNYKFYMHMKFVNIMTIYYFIQHMIFLNCLRNTSINPLLRVKADEED